MQFVVRLWLAPWAPGALPVGMGGKTHNKVVLAASGKQGGQLKSTGYTKGCFR